MARYVGTRIIKAPVERVFDYRLDVRNLPDYNPEVRDVTVIREGTPIEGKTYRFRLRVAPGLRTRVTLAVRNAERPDRLEFHIQALMDARELCVFEPAELEGGPATRISFEYTVNTRGGFLAPLLDAVFVRPSMRNLVEMELDLMKARIEAEPEQSR